MTSHLAQVSALTQYSLLVLTVAKPYDRDGLQNVGNLFHTDTTDRLKRLNSVLPT
jgi:hypothetical protein